MNQTPAPTLTDSAHPLHSFLPTLFGCFALFGWFVFASSIGGLLSSIGMTLQNTFRNSDSPISTIFSNAASNLIFIPGVLLFAISATCCLYRQLWARNLFILACWWLLLLGWVNSASNFAFIIRYQSMFDRNNAPFFAFILRLIGASLSGLLPNYWFLPLLIITRKPIFFWFEKPSLPPAPVGISGWLILPAIGLILDGIFSLGLLIFALIMSLNANYSREITPYIALMIGAVLNLIITLLAAYPFFTRRPSAPIIMIIRLLAQAALSITIITIMAFYTTSNNNRYSANNYMYLTMLIQVFFYTLIPCSIWLTYFTTSRRVRATFARPSANPAPAYVPNNFASSPS